MSLEIDLTGRSRCVTGAPRLGRADALTLARAGADVAIADILVESDTSAADEYGALAQELRRAGGWCTPSRRSEGDPVPRAALARSSCDVTDGDQVGAAVAQVAEELGPVDILANNAGTLDHVAQFADQRLELWERDLGVAKSSQGRSDSAQAVWPQQHARAKVGPNRATWRRSGDAGRVQARRAIPRRRPGFSGSHGRLPGGRQARHHLQRDRPGNLATEAFNMANPAVNERIAEPDGVQACG